MALRRPRDLLAARGPLLFALAAACGGTEPEPTSPANMRDCGPHGELHTSASGDSHCHCDPGYTERNGSCAASAPPPPPPRLDCGPHGTYTGRACECDMGYTQAGLGDDRTCVALPACSMPNDRYEPNDLPSEGTMLSELSGPAYACPGDNDWYLFPVTAGDEVTVELRFRGDDVDLDLLLYGPGSSQPQAWSLASSGDRESASFVAVADGTAGILVDPYGTGEGAYEVSVEVEAGAPPMCANPGELCRSALDCCSGNCHVGHCH